MRSVFLTGPPPEVGARNSFAALAVPPALPGARRYLLSVGVPWVPACVAGDALQEIPRFARCSFGPPPENAKTLRWRASGCFLFPVRLETRAFHASRKQKTHSFRSGFWRFKWYLQESNQGHTDFQSVALPTELRYLI